MNQTAPAERSLGRYHIVKPLKIGGTAAIYLAVMRGENNFSREVVIKRPLPHLVADPRARLMFVDEAHIASRLNHPNICQVLDLVARQHELYLVLEYLRGADLREVLKRCIQLGVMMPPEVAVYTAIEVCSGLDFAHEATGVDGQKLGIVHRDVSPKNIRITDSGSVKIIDFGIARALGRATETAVGTIKGTLGYMSPEQILGDEIDRRSDIFAFGICLFQMLTCRNPFDGPSLKERVRKLTQAPIPLVSEFSPALDEEIAGIVARCLDRDIDVRYQRMRDIQVDLDRYLAKLHVVSPRQRLIHFLEEIFPHIHEADVDLKTALSEVSSVNAKINTEQKLVFPDDPATEEQAAQSAPQQQTRPTMSDSVASTVAHERATEHTPSIGDTKPVARATYLPDPAADRSMIATELDASGPATPKPMPWGIIGAALALVAAIVFVATMSIIDGDEIESAPIVDKPREVVTTPPVTPPPETKTVAKTVETKGTAKTKTRTKTKTRVKSPPRAASGKLDPMNARMYFKTGARLARIGKRADATLMYHLAYAADPRRPNPSVFLNLGILHNDQKEDAKTRACFNAYLARRPTAPEADRIRMTLSALPATQTVKCVSAGEKQRALKQYARRGAKIESWVDETRSKALR